MLNEERDDCIYVGNKGVKKLDVSPSEYDLFSC